MTCHCEAEAARRRPWQSINARMKHMRETISTKKSAQNIQDEIFSKMSPGKKIKSAAELAALCLKLNRLNGANQSGKNSD